jgi:hypothetical protein
MEFDLGLEKHTSVEWLGCAIDRLGIGNSTASRSAANTHEAASVGASGSPRTRYPRSARNHPRRYLIR